MRLAAHISLVFHLHFQAMGSFERYPDGSTRQDVVHNHSQILGHFNSVLTLPNSVINTEQTDSLYTSEAPDSILNNGRDQSHNSGGEVLENSEFQGIQMWPTYPGIHSENLDLQGNLSLEYMSHETIRNVDVISDMGAFAESLLLSDCSYGSALELDDGCSLLSAFSSDSVPIPDSTYTPGPSMVSTPESMLERSCRTSFVAKKQIDMLKEVLKGKVNRKRKRSVESNRNPCEIRISKKIPRDGKYLKEKAWLGTFVTLAQKGRALDVGKYFLCTKKKKTFFDPKSEATLSAFKDLQALPLTELVKSVTKLAKHYGSEALVHLRVQVF
ncbi:hypothetical protein M758_6G023100 [Ceratodon purpureus]|nr:hypothetical protein M758_6G023100 [Ceratodon purpureus]